MLSRCKLKGKWQVLERNKKQMLYYQSKTSTFVLLSPHFISRTGKLGNPCFLSLTALLVVVEQKRALVANVCSVVIEGGIFCLPTPASCRALPS